MVVNHEAAQSAIYHIEAIERRVKLLKQYINPRAGVVTDIGVVAGLSMSTEEEVNDLIRDLAKFL